MAQRIIMGIDPGTNVTGYGIIVGKGKRMEVIAAGVIQLGKSSIDHPAKLKKIYDRVCGLIKEFRPRELALEAPFYGKNVQSMLKLGRAQGVAMAAGLSFDIPIFEYAPKKVKMSVTGKGGASKEQVAGMLKQMLNFEVHDLPLDATDGLAVAVCHFFQGINSKTGTQHKNWGAFVKANPDKLKKR
ncbi:MAG: crossover junction endodeoxyribonuclease RuvC [Bacteroidota bacterium]